VTNFIFNGEITNECRVEGSLAPCQCSTGACD
jgi:hypothetical protein